MASYGHIVGEHKITMLNYYYTYLYRVWQSHILSEIVVDC